MAYHSSWRIPNTANNFAGLGATDGTAEYNNFGSVYDGLLAQAQHLKGYATTEPLKQAVKDGRYNVLKTVGYFGKCPALENLTGDGTPGGSHWASDNQYDVKIKNIMDKNFGAPQVPMKKIIWDPGHHINSDRGFIGDGPEDTEGANNWKVYAEAKKYFESTYYGILQSTRENLYDYPDLPQRAMMAWGTLGSKGADLFISYHSNALNGSVRGTEAYIPTSETNTSLPNKICDAVSNVFGHTNRGVKVNDFTVIKVAKAGRYTWQYMDDNEPSATGQYEPWNLKGGFIQSGSPAKIAMLLEAGFHDNAEDHAIMTTRRAEIARAIVDTIARELNIPKLDSIPTIPGSTGNTPGTGPGTGGTVGNSSSKPVQIVKPKPKPSEKISSSEPKNKIDFLSGVSIFSDKKNPRSNECRVPEYTSCDVVEAADGEFTFRIELPPLDKYKRVTEGMYIAIPYIQKQRNNTHQMFRIDTKETEVGLNKSVLLSGTHISDYELQSIVEMTNPVMADANTALQMIGLNFADKSDLNFYADSQTINTAVFQGDAKQVLLGSDENSFVSKFKPGHLIRDNFDYKFKKLAYLSQFKAKLGNNIRGIKEIRDDSNVVYTIHPFVTLRDNEIHEIPGKYVKSPLKGDKRGGFLELEIKLPESFFNDAGELKDEVVINDHMKKVAENIFSTENIDKPKVTYEIDLVDFSDIDEYQHLKDFFSKTCLHEDIEIDMTEFGYEQGVKQRIIKTYWNGRKITKVEVGDPRELNKYTVAGVTQKLSREIKAIKAVVTSDDEGHIKVGDNFAQTIFNYADKGGFANFIDGKITYRTSGNTQEMYVDGKLAAEAYAGLSTNKEIIYTMRTSGTAVLLQVNDGYGFYADKNGASIVQPGGYLKPL